MRDYNQTDMKAEKNCYTMGIVNYVCKGRMGGLGWNKFQNLGHSLLAYMSYTQEGVGGYWFWFCEVFVGDYCLLLVIKYIVSKNRQPLV